MGTEVKDKDIKEGMVQENDTSFEKPGRLQIDVKITLDSKEAQSLFYGRRKSEPDGNASAIIGLNNFANRMRYIVNAARNDDPYADYFLIKVEKVLQLAKKELALKLNECNDKKKESSLQIGITGSIKPVIITTSYASVHANIALELLQMADKLFVEIRGLVHVALMSRIAGNNAIENIKRLMRRTFLSQQGYKFIGINRQDVELMTVRAETAKIAMEGHLKLFGDDQLPAAILDRTLRAEHSPNIIAMNQLRSANPNRKTPIPLKQGVKTDVK